MLPEPPELTLIDGVPHFRGLALETRQVDVAGVSFSIAGLRDAAGLLDEPDFARDFIEHDRAPYGLELWPAAIMLAQFVLQEDPGRHRHALELGCGLGLVGLAATIAGWRVRVTDHDGTALQFAAYNARRNNIAVHAYALLDWRTPPPQPTYPRIFAGDVLYQLVDHAPILNGLSALLSPGGVALIADPCRGVADPFDALARRHGFSVDITPAQSTNQKGEPVRGRIFRLTKP